MLINDEKPLSITEDTVKLVMVVGIVENINLLMSRRIVLANKNKILNVAYSNIIGKNKNITITDVFNFDHKTTHKLHNRIITYLDNGKNLTWDYASYVKRANPNLNFSDIIYSLSNIYINVLKLF